MDLSLAPTLQPVADSDPGRHLVALRDVVAAVAAGDLARKAARPATEAFPDLGHALDTMVDQLRAVAGEVGRVVREVDGEGRRARPAVVPDAAGAWKELVDGVNRLAAHATAQDGAKDKARQLALRNAEVERKNSEVEQARQALEDKAKQLAQSSRYKSEFLANMSHELRTPLNSLLILSEQLARNAEGNLSQRQVEFARTIHASGNDLLMLINDILDLSKIESGTVAVQAEEIRLVDLQRYVERTFRHVAEARGVGFCIDCQARPSATLLTDAKRLQQILKNLLSNAFKFTDAGEVRLTLSEVAHGWGATNPGLRRARRVLALAVSDTGIGIAADKQQVIFEAFQQADGSTSRKYGGTGLGLAISRELAQLLGGEIRLASEPGRGSTFTLYLPVRAGRVRRKRALAEGSPCLAPRTPLVPGVAGPLVATGEAVSRSVVRQALDIPRIPEDGDVAQAPVLVVDRDARQLARLTRAVRAAGLQVAAARSAASALSLAGQRPLAALVVGRKLGDMPVARLLSRVQHDLSLRHLPVCRQGLAAAGVGAQEAGRDLFVRVGVAEEGRRALATALRCLHDFLHRPRRLLVGLADAALAEELVGVFDPAQVQARVATDAAGVVEALARGPFDAVVLDSPTGVEGGRVLWRALAGMAAAGAPLRTAVLWLAQGATDVPPPPAGPSFDVFVADAPQALNELAVRCLHLPHAGLAPDRRAMLQALAAARRPLAGTRVLVVDDDMRNIFALSSVLEEQGMAVAWADNGRDAIAKVSQDPAIAVVLVDIMMPEFDGLATLRAIRRLPHGRELALVALTAKAMKGDREKCIEAGAWDYLAKPVRSQDLVHVLRAWRWP